MPTAPGVMYAGRPRPSADGRRRICTVSAVVTRACYPVTAPSGRGDSCEPCDPGALSEPHLSAWLADPCGCREPCALRRRWYCDRGGAPECGLTIRRSRIAGAAD